LSDDLCYETIKLAGDELIGFKVAGVFEGGVEKIFISKIIFIYSFI